MYAVMFTLTFFGGFFEFVSSVFLFLPSYLLFQVLQEDLDSIEISISPSEYVLVSRLHYFRIYMGMKL